MPPFKLSDLAKLNLFLAGVITIFILGIAITLLAAGYPLKEVLVVVGVIILILILILILFIFFIIGIFFFLDEALNPNLSRMRRGRRLPRRRH